MCGGHGVNGGEGGPMAALCLLSDSESEVGSVGRLHGDVTGLVPIWQFFLWGLQLVILQERRTLILASVDRQWAQIKLCHQSRWEYHCRCECCSV